MTPTAGWSWHCPCGWGTGRHRLPEHVDTARQAHIRWHDNLNAALLERANQRAHA